MKTLAFIAFSGLVAFAFAAPDHFQTVPSVLCTDVPAQTITVTKECGASAQATAVASSTEDQTNRWSRPEDIIVVTVTKTLPPVTVTETASHASYTTIAPSSSTLSTEVAMMSTATATTTAAGSKQTFHVDVGAFQNGAKKDFLFKPNNISANVGDVVLFNMLGASHSVTQSKFFTPCIKSGPFDTELQDNKKNTTDLIVEEYVVADKNPTWFYCKQRGPPVHCGTGMVFGINPKSDAQMQMFIDMARSQNGTIATVTGTGTIPASTATRRIVAPGGKRFMRIF